jgi:hypothetical protein
VRETELIILISFSLSPLLKWSLPTVSPWAFLCPGVLRHHDPDARTPCARLPVRKSLNLNSAAKKVSNAADAAWAAEDL